MNEQSQKPTMTFEVPVIIPPELLEVTNELKILRTELREEIDRYRATNKPVAYTEQQFAEMFDMSVDTAAKIRKSGRISFKTIAGRIWYTLKNIEDFVASDQTICAGGKKT